MKFYTYFTVSHYLFNPIKKKKKILVSFLTLVGFFGWLAGLEISTTSSTVIIQTAFQVSTTAMSALHDLTFVVLMCGQKLKH